MKAVCKSMNLLSVGYDLFKICEKLKYLILLQFIVAFALGSYVGKHPQDASERSLTEADFIRLKREVIESMKNEKKSSDENHGGAIYVRWGRTECATGSVAVYRGVAGGTWYDHSGGGSNYLCLPLQPIWGAYNEGVEKTAKIYGSEYQDPTSFRLSNNHNRPLHDNNVPCIVCRSHKKTSILMIPARNQCYSGWHTEYTGYLMTERYWHRGRTDFVCMDGEPESDPGGYRNENGALFYNVEAGCGSLPCPPYTERREITCAVCSK